MRAINFKASVRSFSGGIRQLMSNSYDSSRNFDSMIFLDLYARSEHGKAVDDEALLENGLSFACRLLLEVVKNGGSVGFASNCSVDSRSFINIQCGASDAHTEEILKCFAEMSVYSTRNYSIDSLIMRTASQLPRGTDIYLIAPQIDTKTAQTIRTLERMGRNVQIIPLTERRDA